jgi:hypothetical protein
LFVGTLEAGISKVGWYCTNVWKKKENLGGGASWSESSSLWFIHGIILVDENKIKKKNRKD